ncbi:MAG: 4-vinyl reductase [Candidatus Riflebacteria bacterium]|nr:4-vinyl reductase [Candidatus Riflebacteria bacterium]
MKEDRAYEFSWKLLGDLELGRPNLGNQTRVELYRLMQCTLRDVLEKHYDTETADKIFYEAGLLAGKAFYENLLGKPADVAEFIKKLQALSEELKIGIIRFEEADLEQQKFVLTVSEDLDCSGLPELDYELCVYDEGFIAGLMECFFGRKFSVKEVDCWCTGDRTCRFRVLPI